MFAVVPGGVGALWTQETNSDSENALMLNRGTAKKVCLMLTENMWVYFIYLHIPALHHWSTPLAKKLE